MKLPKKSTRYAKEGQKLRKIPPASEWEGERTLAKEKSEEAVLRGKMAEGTLSFKDTAFQYPHPPVTEGPPYARHHGVSYIYDLI